MNLKQFEMKSWVHILHGKRQIFTLLKGMPESRTHRYRRTSRSLKIWDNAN